MEEQLNFFKRFNFSLKPNKYSVYLKDGLSKAIIYVIILSLILGLIKGFLFIQGYSVIEKGMINVLSNPKYSFTYEKGILDLKNAPVSMEVGSNLFLVDTTKSLATINELDNITVHKDTSLVLVKDGFVYKSSVQDLKFSYADLLGKEIVLNNQKLIDDTRAASMVKYFFVILIIIGVFITIMFNGLLIAIAGVVSDAMNKTKLGFGNIFKFALYAMTIPMLVELIIPLQTVKILVGGFIVVFAMGKVRMNRIMEQKEQN